MAESTGYGMAVSFGAGEPVASVNRVASSRTVSGSLVGTCQARPQARSSVAAMTSIDAASLIDVQLRVRPGPLAGEQRLADREREDGVRLEVVAGPHLGGSDPAGLVRGQGSAP